MSLGCSELVYTARGRPKTRAETQVHYAEGAGPRRLPNLVGLQDPTRVGRPPGLHARGGRTGIGRNQPWGERRGVLYGCPGVQHFTPKVDPEMRRPAP